MMITLNRLITGLFLILLTGAFVFYLERILFVDASFILFRIINMDSLQIQEHRYGSFITQAFPLLAARLHLPLSLIVLLYSISFNLFYLVVAYLLVYTFRETALALLMSFYYILFVSDADFWTNNEVHQGIAWMFLFFAVVLSMGRKKANPFFILPVFILLAFLSIYSHPLVLFPAVFLWLFFMIRPDWPFTKKWTAVFSIILLLICASKFYLSTGGDSYYDAEKLTSALPLSTGKIVAAFTSPMAKEIVVRSTWNYWIVPILFFAGLYAAYKQKKYRAIALTLSFSLAYFLAVAITFNAFIPFYTESEWMAGTIIFTALFVYYLLPGLKPNLAVWVIGGIFLVRLIYIAEASGKWIERKEWIMARLDNMREKNISKAIIYENEKNNKVLVMNWGAPTESIIASALHGDNPQKTFVVGSPENIAQRIPAFTGQMIAPFETQSIESLNRHYFYFDTTDAYQVLKTE